MNDQSTRRTRTDLRAIADVVVDGKETVDAARLDRLQAHGWVSNFGNPTGDGTRVGGVADTLRSRDTLDLQVDIMGMAAFVECAKARPTTDVLAYFGGVRTLVNLVDEARFDAGTEDAHDPNGPMFRAYDARNGTVDVAFDDKKTADVFAREWAPDRWDVTRAHDHRFKGGRNPRRLIVRVA